MGRDDRLGFRLSKALRDRCDRAGDTSSVARALLVLGLHAAGTDVSPFADEVSAVLGKITDARLRAALFGVLFNERSTHVQQPSTSTYFQEAVEGDDPLLSVGIEV